MRSQKLFVGSATVFTCVSLASLSLAEPATTQGTPTAPQTPTATTTITPTVPETSTAPAAPTATTTTTSADTEAPATSTYTAPTRESTTLYERRGPNKAVLITGAALFVGTYATTAAITAGVNTKEDHDLYLPIVGPWINIANRSCDGDCSPTHNRNTVLIAGSGILQGVGAGMIITSFFLREKVPTATIAAGPMKITVVPTAGGMGAVGTF
ncbi:hypothetical protein BH11MYX4_BH11MYX4_57370 [soil metagenome]